MVLRDGTLPTAWLSSRKNSVLRCIERLCAETASEHRRAQRRLQEVEEAMATQNQPGSILPGRTMQTAVPVSGGQSAPAASETELLRRKLAEANAEIRRRPCRSRRLSPPFRCWKSRSSRSSISRPPRGMPGWLRDRFPARSRPCWTRAPRSGSPRPSWITSRWTSSPSWNS